jgi:peptide/nickel transport system ATP-binding protein
VKTLGRDFGTSMLFISHNLGLVLETCDRIAVMYSGEAVETGPIAEVFDHMRHPYTQGLFRSIPLPGADKTRRPLIAIPGNFPLPHERPPGCNFGPRCSHFVKGRCDARDIPMEEVTPSHATRCIRWDEIDWAAPPPARTGAVAPPLGDVVITVDGLKKYYQVGSNALFGGDTRVVKANEAVSFEARAGETLAIVGESGCGKSTLAKVLLGLETASSGHLTLGNLEIGQLPIEQRNTGTVASIQMVFQNPFDTLNPSHSFGAQIIRVLERFGIGDGPAAREARMLELLDLVRLPRAFARRMPRQLSGGQKQRVAIARALAGDPDIVVADEPVSALDVSVQAAIINLLMELQEKQQATLIFISHDLSVVRYLADRVAVMYLGRIVEFGTVEEIFEPPYHPYTEALLSTVPIADPDRQQKRILLEGAMPSPRDIPAGCPFATRCPRKIGSICDTTPPPEQRTNAGHRILCHIPMEQLREVEPILSTAAE